MKQKIISINVQAHVDNNELNSCYKQLYRYIQKHQYIQKNKKHNQYISRLADILYEHSSELKDQEFKELIEFLSSQRKPL